MAADPVPSDGSLLDRYRLMCRMRASLCMNADTTGGNLALMSSITIPLHTYTVAAVFLVERPLSFSSHGLGVAQRIF